MYAGRDFSPAQVVESETFGLDFVRDIGSTDFLVTTVWTLAVTPGSNGIDPNPSSHLIGSPALVIPDGTSRVTATTQRIAGLLPDVRYTAGATVTTSMGDTKRLFSHITSVAEE